MVWHKVWVWTEYIFQSQVAYPYGISITLNLTHIYTHTHIHTNMNTHDSIPLLKVLYLSLGVFPTSAFTKIRHEPDS